MRRAVLMMLDACLEGMVIVQRYTRRPLRKGSPFMGNCCSDHGTPLEEPPKCRSCGVTGTIPWGQMAASQRRSFWVEQGTEIRCTQCVRNEKLKSRQSLKNAEEEERKRFIQQAQLQETKEALYPRPTKDASRLKKIESGQAWEGTASFYEGWRPPSFLARLVHFQRKSSTAAQGLVPSGPGLNGGEEQHHPHSNLGLTGQQQQQEVQQQQQAMHAQQQGQEEGQHNPQQRSLDRRRYEERLGKIQQELMVTVDEEPLEGSDATDSDLREDGSRDR